MATLYDKVVQFKDDADLTHKYVHGPASGPNSVIDTESGQVPTLAKQRDDLANAVDSLLFDAANLIVKPLLDVMPSLQYPGEWPDAVCDEHGNPILGVRPDGVAHALLDELPGLDMLDSEFVYAETDAQGWVIAGKRWDGSVYPDVQLSGSMQVFLINGDVWARTAELLPVQVTSGSETASARLEGVEVKYLIRKFGGLIAETASIPSASAWAPFVTKVLHILSSGQSLSMGVGADVWTVNPQCANRLRTLKAGVRLSNQDDTLLTSDCLPLKPLVTNTQEVPVVQQAGQLQRIGALPKEVGIVASAHGRGGMPIASLGPGSTYYVNSITAVAKVREDAVASGLAYAVPYVDWIQGENDRDAAAGVYLTALQGLQAAYETDIKAISGQSGSIPLLLDQISNWTAYGVTSSLVPFDQLKAALQYPGKFLCAGPKYWLQTVPDGIHLTSLASRQLGAMHARAGEAILRGQVWLPTHCTSAMRTNNVVTLKFYTPYGRLVSDTVNISDPGFLGIRWVDDTSSATVVDARVNLDNTVTVILSTTPTGANGYVGIADIGASGAAGGPTTGPRACLRDSSNDRCGDGLALYNWACHQRVLVT